ncbi:PAS domain S-box protein [Phormidium sp. LEGE 05292]|uniref:PAS domain S-box protein n=1 Tax=[Phormidium] sp. LEGE 05292 TaxID=767427 RepID=UPI00187EA7C2|nr:PAS domain S-box protein [Phormidium sp. LEGE 05292]MBE9227501.1 PAS domain S-box protein [Phormidium sp. LEGE 05292]
MKPKQTEEALRESEARFRNAFDYAAIGMAIVGLEGQWLKVNRSICEIVGYSEPELLKTSFQAITHPDDLEKDLNLMQQLLAGEIRYYHLEKRYIHKLGYTVWILLSGSLVRDALGKPLHFIAQIQDITERKLAEEKLRLSEERLHLALEASGEGLWDWNIVTGEFYFSPQWLQMLGYEVTELPYHVSTWESLIHPEDQVWVMDKRNEHLKNDSLPYKFDYRLKTKSGEWKWIANYGRVVVRDRNGAPLRMAGTHRDISDRKQAELALIYSRDLKEAIFNESTDAIFIVDGETLLNVDCNKRAVELFEVDSKDELLNIEGQSLQKHRFLDTELTSIVAEIRERGFWTRELEYVTKKGNIFWGNFAAKQIQVAGQKFNLGRVTDITERKQADDKIRASLKEKEVLLREIHHRVKNNLQVIYSLLNLQSKYIQEESILEIFKDCKNRVRAMAMIHEQLYVSKDMSQIQLNYYIKNLAQELFRSYKLPASLITLHTELDENIFLDPDLAISCGLIINELISNCLKYAFPQGRKGSVQVTAKLDSENKLALIISDDGVGLPQDFSLETFKHLGLKIVKVLSQQINGEFNYESTNKGTEFKILINYNLIKN